jgi:glycosyltransferase involved in cell wall biosynthesis
MQPKISVIVPIYNVAPFLPVCIESILGQAYSDFELILVNDGSLDASHDICAGYQAKDQRVVVINKSNRGLLSARKAGLAVAKGEYIAFVDGDDWTDVDFLASMVRIATLQKVDLVIGGHIRSFEGRNEKIGPFHLPGIYEGAELDNVIRTMLNTRTFFQHGVSTYVWNKLFKSDLLRPVLNGVPNEITMGEDAAITYSFLSKCRKVGITHAANYFYRQRVNSMVKAIQSKELEREHLSNLIYYLYGSLSPEMDKAKLRMDLLFYLYSQALVRFGGFISAEADTIPFVELKKDERVLLYSSGTFGQRLVAANKKFELVQLVLWIDVDHQESQALGLPVASPFIPTEADYDAIIIASIDGAKIEEIRAMLNLYGFDVSKYRHLNIGTTFVINYLRKLGFNLNFFNE